MSLTRRELLRRAGLLGTAALIPNFSACTVDEPGDTQTGGETGDESGSETGDEGDGLPEYEWDGELGPEQLFSHGVASGDPLADSVILWTRLAPADGSEEPESFFELALDPAFEQRVAADYIPATSETRDHTIKIDVDGLEPGTTYYYRFYAQGRVSPIGRTRTAPSGPVDHLRFAFCSCSSWAHGHFHVYDEIGGRADLDAVLHLGDYIYEFGDGEYGDVRPLDPPYEIISLDDYRRRYRLHRSSRGLQNVHRQHPMIATWDDHEIANDGWKDGAANHSEDEEGPWADRRAAAVQAYFEWMPLREGPAGRVYRALPYGDLVDLIVLDTRFEGRDEQININTNPDGLAALADPDRQLLGAEQEQWLFDRLSESTATWILLAQQVTIGQTVLQEGAEGEPSRPLATDPWDGYLGARTRLLDHLRDEGIDNLVVLTGDVHSGMAMEITEDPRYDYEPGVSGSLAVEFVTPSVTSPGFGFDPTTFMFFTNVNPHWRWVDPNQKGYVTVDVRPDRVQADWWLFSGGQLFVPEFSGSSYGASWLVEAGSTVLVEASEPAPERPDPPPLAP